MFRRFCESRRVQKTFLNFSRAGAAPMTALRPHHRFAGLRLRLSSLAFPILRHARSYLAIGPGGRCRESRQRSHRRRARHPNRHSDSHARAPPYAELLPSRCRFHDFLFDNIFNLPPSFTGSCGPGHAGARHAPAPLTARPEAEERRECPEVPRVLSHSVQ